MPLPLARALSIFGHPMLVLPMAVLAIVLMQGDGRTALWSAAGFGAFGALVIGYSWWQVRRGRWSHVDASARHERSALNRFLLVALTAGAVLMAWRGGQPLFALGLALSAAMILIAMLTARWCKLSLHLAFVVFAACLLRELGTVWMLVALLFAGAVAWSRLALQRHTHRDLVAGAVTGALAGLAFWPLASRWTG
ncbi:phosphoesterase [Pseudoxanthomonas sp. PXM02]|uniref:phosphoesterase n=1 Tax=Pseudoxanthomonas sp. PXM02 TaxID=2769294 RepID=UPI00177C964A|nr:phosphoesterase [Pseudoxanthomonas sp. PXM02]MBD9478040.1 phosphoesterase [Pseudoxanthomonas sp. PXM02]